jgi:hypothetical protein
LFSSFENSWNWQITGFISNKDNTILYFAFYIFVFNNYRIAKNASCSAHCSSGESES